MKTAFVANTAITTAARYICYMCKSDFSSSVISYQLTIDTNSKKEPFTYNFKTMLEFIYPVSPRLKSARQVIGFLLLKEMHFFPIAETYMKSLT